MRASEESQNELFNATLESHFHYYRYRPFFITFDWTFLFLFTADERDTHFNVQFYKCNPVKYYPEHIISEIECTGQRTEE